MKTRAARDSPARPEGARRRFEGRRRTPKVRCRIPGPLWAAAVKAAGTYGIHRAAKALQVDYHSLKKRGEGTPAGTDSKVPAGAAGAAFIRSPFGSPVASVPVAADNGIEAARRS